MWSLTKIIGLVIIPLMIGSAVLGSLQTIRAESVNENYGIMDAMLERENNRLHISPDSIESANENEHFHTDQPGAEMVRDVIAVNQLSALSCTRAADLISGRMYLAQTGDTRISSNDADDVEIEGDIDRDKAGLPVFAPEYVQEELDGTTDGHTTWKVTPWHAFAGRDAQDPEVEQAPNYAFQFSNYTPRCVGIQSVDSALPRAGFAADPVGYIVDGTVDTVVSAPYDVWDAVTCKTVPDFIKQSGNDMEGRYGRIPFSISSNLEDPVVLGSDSKINYNEDSGVRRDMVWMANFVTDVESESGTCWVGAGVGAVISTGVALGSGAAATAVGGPAAGAMVGVAAGTTVATGYDWAGADVKIIPTMGGAQWARYAPYSINVIEGDANWPGINLKNGHVVVDAPVVLEGGAGDENYIEYGSTDNGQDLDTRGRRFQEKAKYVLCPGVEGYIQTNREDDGRSGGEHIPTDEGKFKDSRITTYIRVTSDNADSCVNSGGTENYVKVDDDVRIQYYVGIDS